MLWNLAAVLAVAAITTVIFQRLKQPVVLGYLLAGMILGPYLPVPITADAGTVHTLSDLGVILVMFSIGLEFRLSKLVQVAPRAGVTAALETSVLFLLGFSLGRLCGWGLRESLFTGGVVAISSTTIIAKAYAERRVEPALQRLVFGVLIVEDLIAILLLAVLTTVAKTGTVDAAAITSTAVRLGGFLLGLVAIGLVLVPRIFRSVIALQRPETTLVASVGLCFSLALLAQYFGYSVALGAFVAGMLIAESGEGAVVEHLVAPVRDMFAAIFFVSVGMSIDPSSVAKHWHWVALFTGVVVFGKMITVAIGAMLTGHGLRVSTRAGMSLAQIGEFSFIIAGLGGTQRLYTVAVAVSAITSLLTPALIKASDHVADKLGARLPTRVTTFFSLYERWVETLSSPSERNLAGRMRRRVLMLIVDAVVILGLLVLAARKYHYFQRWLQQHTGLSGQVALGLVFAVLITLALPFFFGLIRSSRFLAAAMAARALPEAGEGKLDLSATPRRAFVLMLQLIIVVITALPMVAAAQPFLPSGAGLLLLLVTLVVVSMRFWTSSEDLEQHVRAGAEVVVAAFAKQARAGEQPSTAPLLELSGMFRGLGEPVAHRLRHGTLAVGQTLASLNLRSRTGATVLAVMRGDEKVLMPRGDFVLAAGDVLALAGSAQSVAEAETLLS